ncbi:MAG: HypC/HybG/HupF family hydrogenase formation chaperone [Nitrososphaerota archaeon]
MCWGAPGKVLEIDNENKIAKIDFGGVVREALLAIDDVNINDFVMVHAGVIIGKMDPKDVATNLALYSELAEINYREMGLSPEEASSKAMADFKKLLSSLGLDAQNIEGVGKDINEDDEVDAKDKLEIPSNAFKRTYKISLSDTDYLQVMHYTNYFKFCERCQQELLASVGFGYSTLIHKFGRFIPTVETGGKILSPVRLDNEIEVIVWVEEIGRKHVKFRNFVWNKTSNKLAADIYTVGVCTDTSLTESIELPEGFAKALEQFISKTKNK